MNARRSCEGATPAFRTIVGLAALLALGGMGVFTSASAVAEGEVLVYPTADGTLADGGIYGDFDGAPDNWDWTFNQSGYEGAVTLTTETPQSSQENRVVWEYGLSGLTLPQPLTARLTFTARGATVLPMPDAEVHVYSVPSDLVEMAADYAAGPAELQGSVTIPARQEPTEYTINVTEAVREAAASNGKVAFRFQINPNTVHGRNQAFIDAADTDFTTKPYIAIIAAIPGDFNGDGHVNLVDFSTFSVCFGVSVSSGSPSCPAPVAEACDLDGSGVVNLSDFSTFAINFGR